MRNHIGFLTLAAVAAGCPGRITRNPDQSDRHLELAEDYIGKKMYVPALQEALKAVELDPENADAHRMLGDLYLQQALEEKQVLQWRQCLEGAAARDQQARVDAELDRAGRHLSEAARLRSPFSEALNNLAAIAIERRDWDGALRHTEEALANPLYTGRWAAEGNRGFAFFRKGDLVRAELSLKRALLEQPDFCLGRYWLAQVLHGRKQCERVIAELDRVLADERCQEQDAYHLRGMCLALAGRRDEAARDLERCQQLAPESCKARECRRDRKLVN